MPAKKYYAPRLRTRDMVIDEKLKVLRDFYIVDDHNEKEIRSILLSAIAKEPTSDMDVVVDRVARSMIAQNL